MKVKHITQYLFESYKDAKQKFSQEAPEGEVKQYLDTFKQLANKGIASGQEKDIGYWIRQGWNAFKQFVDEKSQEKSKSEVKKSKKKDSIIVHDDEDYFMVIPLTKDASCYYGKNTKWCTSATENRNYFIDYFYRDREAFMYIIDKSANEKYAVVYDTNENKIAAAYDENDKKAGPQQFQNMTGISLQYIKDMFIKNLDTIEKAMDINNVSDKTLAEIAVNGVISISDIIDPSEYVQLEIVKDNPHALSEIKNPTEKTIYEALKRDPRETIENLDEQYITEKLAWEALKIDTNVILELARSDTKFPTQEMIDYVFEKDPLHAVQFYEDVTEEMAWKIVKKHPAGLKVLYNETNGEYPTEEMAMYYFDIFPEDAIAYINNPTVEQQMKAIKSTPLAINKIKNPDPKVKLEAIKLAPELISRIENPTTEMIKYIISLNSDELVQKLTFNPTINVKDLDKDLKEKIAKIMGLK